MLAGAALYAEAHPWLATHVLGVGAGGKVTLPGLTHTSEWLWFAAMAAAALTLFAWLRTLDRRRRPVPA